MQTGRAALGQYAARGKQNLILIRPVNGILAMECLHYADEVRATSDVPVPEGEVKPLELALAKQLIEAGIERRVRAEQVPRHGARPRDGDDPAQSGRPGHHERRRADGGSKVLDLMEALRASLAGVQKDADAKVKVS
jgi:DNA end-binding protein Ku